MRCERQTALNRSYCIEKTKCDLVKIDQLMKSLDRSSAIGVFEFIRGSMNM